MKNKKTENKEGNKLLVVIRIHGMVKVRYEIEDDLYRLRLRKKYTCVLINSNDESAMGMLKKVKFYVAYGAINKETLAKLLLHRAMPDLSQKENSKKIMEKLEKHSEEIAEELIKGKKLSELGLKPFFRLHPPRKGIKSKLQYPKGVLGDNKEDINKLVERML